MTKREIAILSFKVLSVYAFVQAIQNSYYILYYLIYKNQLGLADNWGAALRAIPPLLSAICGIGLWYAAPLLAKFIFKSEAPGDGTQASLVNVQTTAFSVVGLFLLATGFPNLVNVVLVILTSSSVQGSSRALIHEIFVFVFKIALGLWLLFGSHGLVKFIRSMQRD